MTSASSLLLGHAAMISLFTLCSLAVVFVVCGEVVVLCRVVGAAGVLLLDMVVWCCGVAVADGTAVVPPLQPR